MVVVSVDSNDTRSVHRSVQNLRRFEIGGNEHARVKSLLRRLRCHRIRQIPSGRAPHGSKPNRFAATSAVPTTRSLNDREGKHTASFLKKTFLIPQSAPSFRDATKGVPPTALTGVKSSGSGKSSA